MTPELLSSEIADRRKFPRKIPPIQIDLQYTSEKCEPREAKEAYLGANFPLGMQKRGPSRPREVYVEGHPPQIIYPAARPRFYAFSYKSEKGAPFGAEIGEK